MVDIDFDELHKGRGLNINLPIQSDAGLFIDNVLDNIINIPLQDRMWLEKCTEWKNWIEKRNIREDNTLTSYEAVKEINKIVADDEIIIPDEGGHLIWCMQTFKLKNQRMFSNS